MRRRTVLRLGGAGGAVALAGCLGATGEGGAPAAGATPEEGTIDTLDVAGSSGERVPVVAADRVTLLDFWATWCAPCEPQMAELRSVREEFPDVHLLSITNEEDEAAVREFWTEFGGTWPVAMDPGLRTNDRFDVTRIPTLLVLDPSGSERWRHVGLAAADTIAEQVREAGA